MGSGYGEWISGVVMGSGYREWLWGVVIGSGYREWLSGVGRRGEHDSFVLTDSTAPMCTVRLAVANPMPGTTRCKRRAGGRNSTTTTESSSVGAAATAEGYKWNKQHRANRTSTTKPVTSQPVHSSSRWVFQRSENQAVGALSAASTSTKPHLRGTRVVPSRNIQKNQAQTYQE